MDLSTIGTLKVAELKAELEKRNISKSGTKSVLVERLRQALTAEQEATENPENPDEEGTETIADEATIDNEFADMVESTEEADNGDNADNGDDNGADDGDNGDIADDHVDNVDQAEEPVEAEKAVEAPMDEDGEDAVIEDNGDVNEDASLLDDDAIDYGDLDYGEEAKEEIISFQIDDAEALSLDAPEIEEEKKEEEEISIIEPANVEQKEVKKAETDDKSRRPSRPTEG